MGMPNFPWGTPPTRHPSFSEGHIGSFSTASPGVSTLLRSPIAPIHSCTRQGIIENLVVLILEPINIFEIVGVLHILYTFMLAGIGRHMQNMH